MYTIRRTSRCCRSFNFRAHQQHAYRRHSAMVDISVQTLSDAIARYSVKSNPASTSTNNNVPWTVVTTTSAIVSAYRRVHGVNPPDGNLGDLSWLTLRAIVKPPDRGPLALA